MTTVTAIASAPMIGNFGGGMTAIGATSSRNSTATGAVKWIIGGIAAVTIVGAEKFLAMATAALLIRLSGGMDPAINARSTSAGTRTTTSAIKQSHRRVLPQETQ